MNDILLQKLDKAYDYAKKNGKDHLDLQGVYEYFDREVMKHLNHLLENEPTFAYKGDIVELEIKQVKIESR